MDSALMKSMIGRFDRNAFEAFFQRLMNKSTLYHGKIDKLSDIDDRIFRKKEHVVRQFIMTIDDAHFDNIKPESELIFIDYAAFLQRAWNSIGTYLKIITP